MVSKLDQLIISQGNKFDISINYSNSKIALAFTTIQSLERAAQALTPYGEVGWLRSMDYINKLIDLNCPVTVSINQLQEAVLETLLDSGFEVNIQTTKESSPSSDRQEMTDFIMSRLTSLNYPNH